MKLLWISTWTLVAILIRVLVGLNGYSGAHTPPKYGDYEAQRHWMEITLHTPLHEWYVETPDNPLGYWGLDYPPMSAYQSWVCGHMMHFFDPESVAVETSRGWESPSSKRIMRLTVILADLLVFLPAVLYAGIAIMGTIPLHDPGTHVIQPPPKHPQIPQYSPPKTRSHTASRRNATTQQNAASTPPKQPQLTAKAEPDEPKSGAGVFQGASVADLLSKVTASDQNVYAVWTIIVVASMQPAAILIDHGHFQYNNISLGLTAAAVGAILHGRQLLGSCLFVMALNHKHMAMYYSPAFFSYLLGKSLRATGKSGRWQPAIEVCKLGLVVVATFLAIWAPFLSSPQTAVQVLRRLVPIQRGLFEDYVANFWCVTHPLFKWKRILSHENLARLCAAMTLIAVLPACGHQVSRPSRKGFLYCLTISSLGFFMFSYQVHEKSFLLPMLPVTLLVAHEPHMCTWILPLAAFSMYPLLEKDGVHGPYATLLVTSCLMMQLATYQLSCTRNRDGKGVKKGAKKRDTMRDRTSMWYVVQGVSSLGMIAVHACRVWLPAPQRLPYLHDAVLTAFAGVQFGGLGVYCMYKLLQLEADR